MPSENILLTEMQFCHIIDKDTGKIRLIEGPYCGTLESREEIHGVIMAKLNVKEDQYVIIEDPFDTQTGKIKYGSRVQIIGPKIFSLYPNEILLKDRIYDAVILNENEAIYIEALKAFDESEEVRRNAGDIWMVRGPAYYIPSIYEKINKRIESIPLGNFEGLYIQNIKTGEIRLEKGPTQVILTPDEMLYKQDHPTYSTDSSKVDLDEIVKSARAPILWVYDNQAVLLFNDQELKVIIGPNHVLLEPFQKPYVMSISGGVPKRSGVHRIWKLKLGPDFMTDVLEVRTKDNAELKVTVRYKWRFNLDPDNPEKVFSIKDFIGYSVETLAGIIRSEAANYNFEEFHGGAVEIIKAKLFPGGAPFLFDENGFEIFHIDIKKIVPVDTEIAKQLNSAIKSNMDVYVKKIRRGRTGRPESGSSGPYYHCQRT